eukprot:CAMPEP_0206437346 /NCGR_PEP_ID=MMETSP0324_2-20121206/10989_1 /ASSEMBLY_ACC=CAM_ASM_000836 /TAXON_ID=2866 /ORGANISM="Crypthecodinium cohnii, Strain Seligo" /LENGTH=42 /DNA_ID= /DNA_START= /DNA_END= /DNA_ORIENTATION=
MRLAVVPILGVWSRGVCPPRRAAPGVGRREPVPPRDLGRAKV